MKVKRAIDHEPIEWVVEGMFGRKDIVTLVGESGSGKTTFALHMCHAITLGIPLMETNDPYAPPPLVTAQGRPLIISQDDSPGRLRDKVMKLEHDLPGVSQLEIADEWYDWQKVANLQLNGRYNTLVVDSLMKMGVSVDVNAEMGMVYDAWSKMAREQNIALIILHHRTDKTPGRGASKQMYIGAAAIKGNSDAMYLVDRTSSGATLLRTVKIRDYELPEYDISHYVDYKPEDKGELAYRLLKDGYDDAYVRRTVCRVFRKQQKYAYVVVRRAQERLKNGA